VSVAAAPRAHLANEVLAHLDAQLASARHLLDLILQQGRAIRARDVDAVLARLAAIQAEVERRNHLEAARTDLLTRAGQALGVPAGAVTLKQMTALMPPAEAALALERSAELTGLLAEVAREHGINRALMRQELTFLSHLTRLVGGEPEGGYRPPTAAPAASTSTAPPRAAATHRLLDLQA
jgi:FlgN protein